MLASIAILTNNRERQVLRAIHSAKKQIVSDGVAFEIVVVDNASTDNTLSCIRAEHPDVKLVRTHRNLGCPGGRNILYANCSGEVIVNLDDDGEMGDGVVQGAVDIFRSDPTIGVIAFQRVETSSRQVTEDQATIDVSSFSGGLSAFRRDVINRVGYYPDDYFLLAEEEHLAIRILDAGLRIVYSPHLVMIHPIGGSHDERWDYYRYRNSLLNVVELFPAVLCAPFFVLRMGSYLAQSLTRGMFKQCLAAIVAASAGFATRTRRPVAVATIRKYRRLRRISR